MPAKKKIEAVDTEEVKTYEVVSGFSDMEDGLYVYHIGDIYPRNGYKPTQARVKSLLGSSNRLKKPIIRA